MGRLALGQWVIISGKAVKTHPSRWADEHQRTTWERVAIEPIKAMYIGWRVVYNGEIYRNGDGYGEGFKSDRGLYVMEFVSDERRLPFKVFFKDVRDDLTEPDMEAARIPLYSFFRLTRDLLKPVIREYDENTVARGADHLFLAADNQKRALLPIPEGWRLPGFCYSSTLKDAEGVAHEVILGREQFELLEPVAEKELA